MPIDNKPMTKFIVAIHGIGNQRRSATIRTVATQFGELGEPPLAIEPLGYFDLGSGTSVGVRRIELQSGEKLGFAEVYWANIPREIALRNDTLDESKFWGRTVASRAQQLYRKALDAHNHGAARPDAFSYYKVDGFNRATGVIEEFVEGVGVIENLLFIAAKAGLVKLELEPLLSDYVGGVQLVADFKEYRNEIVGKFHAALAQVVRLAITEYKCMQPEIYVVAHSEGSVIAFAALLQALRADPNVPPRHDYVRHMRGLMTIGSPIDKHLLLFPDMWKELGLPSYPHTAAPEPAQWRNIRPIVWYNFYDYGDPIGFELDTARLFLKQIGCDQRLVLTEDHDYGFARYIFPGKAHNEYWTDDVVFRRFIYGVMGLRKQNGAAPTSKDMAKPTSRLAAQILGPAIPYAVALLLHILAIFCILKPFNDNVCPIGGFREFAASVFGLGLLLAGTTVAARLARLVSRVEIRWLFGGAALFLFGSVMCYADFDDAGCFTFPFAHDLLPLASRAIRFAENTLPFGNLLSPEKPVNLCVIAAMFALWAISAIPPWRARWGRTILVASGSVALLGTTLTSIYAKMPVQHSLTPVVIGAAAFLYLWWLGMILFDLTFLWHRYIRRTVALDTMRDWSRGLLRRRAMVGRYKQD